MNKELLRLIISDMVEKKVSYFPYNGKEKKEVYIKNKEAAVELIRDALGYENKTSVYKLLSGKTKWPREDKMKKLEELLGVSFYLQTEQEENENTWKEKSTMALNELSKKFVCKMYATTISFFNKSVDFVEELDEHLLELEEYRLGVPTEIFERYIEYLVELAGDLPEIDCSDILEEGNVVPNEECLNTLLYRYYKRTTIAKRMFIEFAREEFADLVLR